MSEQRVTLADILAETQTDRRGTCPRCHRVDVPISPRGICLPCSLNPGWHESPHTIADAIKKLIGNDAS